MTLLAQSLIYFNMLELFTPVNICTVQSADLPLLTEKGARTKAREKLKTSSVSVPCFHSRLFRMLLVTSVLTCSNQGKSLACTFFPPAPQAPISLFVLIPFPFPLLYCQSVLRQVNICVVITGGKKKKVAKPKQYFVLTVLASCFSSILFQQVVAVHNILFFQKTKVVLVP